MGFSPLRIQLMIDMLKVHFKTSHRTEKEGMAVMFNMIEEHTNEFITKKFEYGINSVFYQVYGKYLNQKEDENA
jgi:hypothetical protein